MCEHARVAIAVEYHHNKNFNNQDQIESRSVVLVYRVYQKNGNTNVARHISTNH